MDKPAQRYLKRLSRGLICSREDRERLLRNARAMLENFSQENPGAFYGDYAASFGPPEEFAAQMMYNMLDNATIWAFPQSSTELGEKTNRYGYQNGKDGRPLTFFDVHFTDWERENIF